MGAARPLKHIRLRNAVIAQRDFLTKFNKCRKITYLKKKIKNSTESQIKLLFSIICAHFDGTQEVSLERSKLVLVE